MIRASLLALVLAGCGAPGPILEVSASNVPPGTSDIRTTVEDETRMVRWDGSDPFVFQVLFELQGDVVVQVDAIEYPVEGDPLVIEADPNSATLAEGTVARVDIIFE